jgi:hypothetical protein
MSDYTRGQQLGDLCSCPAHRVVAARFGNHLPNPAVELQATPPKEHKDDVLKFLKGQFPARSWFRRRQVLFESP